MLHRRMEWDGVNHGGNFDSAIKVNSKEKADIVNAKRADLEPSRHTNMLTRIWNELLARLGGLDTVHSGLAIADTTSTRETLARDQSERKKRDKAYRTHQCTGMAVESLPREARRPIPKIPQPHGEGRRRAAIGQPQQFVEIWLLPGVSSGVFNALGACLRCLTLGQRAVGSCEMCFG